MSINMPPFSIVPAKYANYFKLDLIITRVTR